MKNLVERDIDALEQKFFAGKANAHVGDVPPPRNYLGLLHQEVSAAVQSAQDSPSEAYVFAERSVDLGDAMLVRIDQDVTLQPGKHLFHAAGRDVFWIRTKPQADEPIAGLPDLLRPHRSTIGFVEKSVRQGPHNSQGALLVFFFRFLLFL